MTFYWWSHWFWITLICNLLPFIVVVHTYPSQDSTSQEYNQHQQPNEQTKKAVTKLHQASTSLAWVTESSLSTSMLSRTTMSDKTTLLLTVVSPTTTAPEPKATTVPQDNKFDYYYYDNDVDEQPNKTEPIDLEDVEEEQENKDHQREQQQRPEFANEKIPNDVKRSAEQFSETADAAADPSPMATTTIATTTETNQSASEMKSNYTNYTEQIASSTNTTQQQLINASNPHVSLNGDETTTAAANASMSTLTNSSVTTLPHAPATPKIVKTHSTEKWLGEVVASVAASPPPIRVTTTDVTDDKFPFTLENVHKSEDLRRDENEPRRRQSKGLSAEYKPPGYINYAPESKNLLTRSASTTVNEYESEENNISSEALSVQRAYFMDVGAISAICFTVFGICCTVGTIGIVLYRRRFLNKPQALSEPDSSVYIDDSTMRVSDNSDEMYSLDNDSFLNSLEAMTIQNYWTDTVKHTKL